MRAGGKERNRQTKRKVCVYHLCLRLSLPSDSILSSCFVPSCLAVIVLPTMAGRPFCLCFLFLFDSDSIQLTPQTHFNVSMTRAPHSPLDVRSSCVGGSTQVAGRLCTHDRSMRSICTPYICMHSRRAALVSVPTRRRRFWSIVCLAVLPPMVPLPVVVESPIGSSTGTERIRWSRLLLCVFHEKQSRSKEAKRIVITLKRYKKMCRPNHVWRGRMQ